MRNSRSYPSRRQFIGATSSAAAILGAPLSPARNGAESPTANTNSVEGALDLVSGAAHAPCTFVFFRKEFEIARVEGQAKNLGDWKQPLHAVRQRQASSTRPAPCDPRYWMSIRWTSPRIFARRNVIGGLVCSFGGGDGTYVPGHQSDFRLRGFMLQAAIPPRRHIRVAYGRFMANASGECWPAAITSVGTQALQEEFDARRYPYVGTRRASTRSAGGLRPS